jgi:fatty-acyl-CoA synthase
MPGANCATGQTVSPEGCARSASALGTASALWSTNCVEGVMLQLGCARAGAILVNVNPAYRTHEPAFTLRKSRMKALFLWERDSPAEYARILEEARHGQALPLEHVVLFGTLEWEPFLCAQCGLACPSKQRTSPTFSTPPAPPPCPRA